MNYDNRREPVITDDSIKDSMESVVGKSMTIAYSSDTEGMRQHNDLVKHEEPSSVAVVNDQDTSRQSAVNAAEAVMLLAAAVSASYSDEATSSQQGMIMNPQSLLSTEEMKLNQPRCHPNENEVVCRDHTDTIKPIKDNAIVQGRLHSLPPSRIFRLNDKATVPNRSSTSFSSATQGDPHNTPTGDAEFDRPNFFGSLGEDGEAEICVLPWTRRFYEETRNDMWQEYGNGRENTRKDDEMIIRTSTSAMAVAGAAVLRRPSSGFTTGTKECVANSFKASLSSSYSNCSALFPMQLHCALSHPSAKCKLALEWVPHGKSWRILRWEALDNILPQFFPECGNSIDVFLDMVEAWGFQRITDGSARYADQGSYYHEYFQLDSPGLCQRMSLHSPAQATELHEAPPLKRCRLINGCDLASSFNEKENDVNNHSASPSVATTTDATFWNHDANEEKLGQLDCRVPHPLPLSRNSTVVTRYEGSRTLSNRGGRPAAGYHNATRGTTPDRLLHRKHSSIHSYRSNLSNSSSFGSSFEDNDAYNNGYYADLSYRRSNLNRGHQQAFSFDSSCNASERLKVGDDLHQRTCTGSAGLSAGCGNHNLKQRLRAVVDHSPATKSIKVRRDEDHLRGTSNAHKLSNDNALGSYIWSSERSFKTPDRKSLPIPCKGDAVIEDKIIPQTDNLRRKQAPTQDVSSTSKPSVVTPSSVVRPLSLCSSRGGKSTTSASYTPVLFSNEVENGTKATVYNVSRRGSFAKRVSATKSSHQAADDQPKIMLSFH